MSWFSGIPRIGNKDTCPNDSWEGIFDSVLDIFSGTGTIIPSELRSYNKKELKKFIQTLLEDIDKNKDMLSTIDCDLLTSELIKLLRPGKTATLLIDSIDLMEDLKEKYGGERNGPYIFIKLSYVDEQGRHPSFRLFHLKDYKSILEILKILRSESSYMVMIIEILTKIELAAFCKGGDRRARWKLDQVHSEYGSEEECHKVAAKLTYLFLDILKKDLEAKDLNNIYQIKLNAAKEKCLLLLNEKEKAFLNSNYPLAVCPLCLKKINVIDFFRNGRNDPFSITFGHYEFRGDKTKDVHKGKNAFWIHRTCNYIQGEYTIQERLNFLKEIIKNQESINIDWENRG